MSATPRGYAKDQPVGFLNRVERIAIVGAGGQMGRHITGHLLETGKHDITAITRPNSTSKMPDGVKVVRVDYGNEAQDDIATLVDTLRGQQVLLITMSHTALGTTKNLIRAAPTAGVACILSNWFGHDANNKQLIEDPLMTSLSDNVKDVDFHDVSSYFLLVCSFCYEFSLDGCPHRYGFDFKDRSLILYDGGDVAIITTTWPQCGRTIANLLSLKQRPDDENDTLPTLSRFRNECVYISSFRLSQRDMFESVKRVTGTNDAGWMKMGYSRMFFPNGGGDYETSRGLHNDVLGIPVEDLEEFTARGIRMGENGEVWP